MIVFSFIKQKEVNSHAASKSHDDIKQISTCQDDTEVANLIADKLYP